MPVISMFYGIIIMMYSGNEHNPPHFHARYQDFSAVFDFDGNLIKGKFPDKQTKYIVAWADIHHDELVANWQLSTDSKQVYKIDPLR